MSAVGPTIIGGASTNNGFSVQITPQANVPAGAMIVVSIATSAPDVTDMQVTDTVGNVYNVQVASQPPGSATALFVMYTNPTTSIALPTTGRITVTAPQRFSIIAGALHYTGAQGSFTASDVEWFTGTQCSYTVNVNAGDNLLALMSVNGPQADGFVQAANFGADLGAGVGGTNYSIHGGAAVASANGTATYAPTLGKAKQSVGFLLAFK
jgi:hypothetical protein